MSWLFIFMIDTCLLIRIMELIHGTHKASKSAPQDFISNMPDNVVTNILDRLALRDAVRTSILSRNWRFKWTTLSQLVITASLFWYLAQKTYKNHHVRVINRILLHLRGAITKFFLSIDEVIDDEDINHWILFLSSKGIKDLTIRNWHEPPLKLHNHLFSCLELKHLTLSNCYFNPPPTFHGFPNLLSLKLSVLFEENSNLGALFTGSPLLESLAVNDRRGLGKLTEGDANKRFSTSVSGLKYLRLTRICLDDGMKLSCALDLIRSFPNLQTLIIIACDEYSGPPQPVEDYNTIRLLQLRSVHFTYNTASENELCLIKYLLAYSPFLKKIVISGYKSTVASNEKLTFARKLLMLHRASPVAEIELL
ncbi:putative F-box domain, FBD domain, leucine-rich repeat domain superfamily [Helianthus annuus]|nr:putative F-box domain, FBD domain, leucine-rich repeat domain superfamily [Helianthus annuus]